MSKQSAFQEAKAFEEYGKYREKKLAKKGLKARTWSDYNKDMESRVDKIVYEARKVKEEQENALIKETSKELSKRYAHDSRISRSYIIK